MLPTGELVLLTLLRIGGLPLPNNLIQAPLAGYSSAPFRLLIARWGGPGLTGTEMISANALAQMPSKQARYLTRLPGEGMVSYQLWGREPQMLGRAAEYVAAAGADAVDLNCGCPVRKVRAAGAGSKLMEEPELVGRLVAAMRAAVKIPVTVKIRVGTSADHFNGPEVARAAEAAGADLIAVHGRHAKESYGTPVRYAEIERVVRAVKVPVAGNGDVRDGASARRMFETTGCAAAMVGRACMGAPWIFARIRAELAGESYLPPPAAQIGDTLLEHHDLLVPLLGEDKAVRHCRKLGAFYSKFLAGGKDFRGELNFCQTRADLERLTRRFFGHNSNQESGSR